MIYIVCLLSNVLRFEKLFLTNEYLKDSQIKVIPLRKNNTLSAGSLYNSFLNSLPDDAQWVCFTTDALEIQSNLSELLHALPDNSFYGAFGARGIYNKDSKFLQECMGKITESIPEKQPSLIYNKTLENENNKIVDTLESRCLIIPARLIRDYKLRFNDELDTLYGEDFCLQAFNSYKIKSSLINLQVSLHEPLFYDQTKIKKDISLCIERYKNMPTKAGVHNIFGKEVDSVDRIVIKKGIKKHDSKVYKKIVDLNEYNLPSVLAARMIKQGSRVLDVGCACGDNGIFMKQHLSCEMYGMDYDAPSLKLAGNYNCYESLHQVDLNCLKAGEYAQYYRFFDTILLLDVLEHLYSPQDVLQALSLFLKKDGSFVISLPNLAHLYPVLSLFNKEFTYNDFGILDSTHIRFFTWKSIALSLAQWGFRIDQSYATFLLPNRSCSNAPTMIPAEVTESLLQDRHSLACQYVCKISLSDESFVSLKAHNLEILEKSVSTNPEGWQVTAQARDVFNKKLARTAGTMLTPNEVKNISRLIEQKQFIEALLASGFFDEEWYKNQYSEVNFDTIHPLEHYLNIGWKEGKNPSEAFDGVWYQKVFANILPEGICPLVIHLNYGIQRGLPHNRMCGQASKPELARYAQHVINQEKDYPNTFVKMNAKPYKAVEGDPKLIAFYLPQFSPFPENDQWWGKGFTEWTNVTKATPLYTGHYQPHLPYDLGLYDLRVKETCLRQEELARHYGIHGFCYHYYWFDGKKIMNTPIEEKLRDSNLSLPFCISWANEAWSANWDGSQNNLLIGQPQKIKTEELFYDLLPFFKDERYIRVNGKPFFMMYRPTYFETETVHKFMNDFQLLAQKNGLPGLHLTIGTTRKLQENLTPLSTFGADAYVEFPPHRFTYEADNNKPLCNKNAKADIYSLPRMLEIYKRTPLENASTYRTVFPMWDNTSRKAEGGATIFEDATPSVYFEWLRWCMQATETQGQCQDNKLVFINAWNEWAEGAHLEPDRKYGYAFLEMTKQAIYAIRKHNRG